MMGLKGALELSLLIDSSYTMLQFQTVDDLRPESFPTR
jgi:hypothetical protein